MIPYEAELGVARVIWAESAEVDAQIGGAAARTGVRSRAAVLGGWKFRQTMRQQVNRRLRGISSVVGRPHFSTDSEFQKSGTTY